MIIETYQEKTIQDDELSIFLVDKGNYRIKNRSVYERQWETDLEYWDKRARVFDDFIEEKPEGCFKYDLGTQWGINSYMLVYPTMEE